VCRLRHSAKSELTTMAAWLVGRVSHSHWLRVNGSCLHSQHTPSHKAATARLGRVC